LNWFCDTYRLGRAGGQLRQLRAPEWYLKLQRLLKANPEALKDWIAGRDCINRCCHATWWEWTEGSRPHFWRWSTEYRLTIRDGLPPWFKMPLPRWLIPQRLEPNLALRKAMKEKLGKVRRMGYLAQGEVKSLTSFFAVPKGDSDIRMVYDGTKSGLNDAMWAPWFWMPTVESHLRFVSTESFLGDIDVGDMFLNFVLHEDVRKVAGVDLSLYFPDELIEGRRVLWERWTRCGMGFRSSPYNTIQAFLFAEEQIRGNPWDLGNVLHCDAIRLNLPGSLRYEPSQPWVSKVRSQDGLIACDFIIYVNVIRSSGNSWEESRGCARKVASTLNWLGLQDAARKRRDPSKTPGPWAGSIVHTEKGTITVSIPQERWDKAKCILLWIETQIKQGDTIEFKTLESHRGFLVYIARTYPMINPYLKGIHLTLDSWRPWRKEDGWKMSMQEIRVALAEKGLGDDTVLGSGERAPQQVKWVPRLVEDVRALSALFHPENSPKCIVRPTRMATAIYAFGDASGVGFGSSISIDGQVYYSGGQWTQEQGSESSNYRELANLIFALEEAHRDHVLDHAELFVFTDNSTAELAAFKGTSSSSKLFELILQLRQLEMQGSMIIHFIHIAGKRMIAQGTDGLSRGSSLEGIMQGKAFMSFVPLHLSAEERQGHFLTEWVGCWFGATED
jgi:hypothetical protein